MTGERFKKLKRGAGAIVVAALALSALGAPSSSPARASITGCEGSVSPQAVSSGQGTDLQFQITNNDPSNAITWIEIDTPGGYFTGINSVSAPGWSSSVDGNNYVTLTGGSIQPGDTFSYTINAQAFNGQSPPAFWYTHISDDPTGSTSNLCDGDFNVQIAAYGNPPVISNVMLSNLGPHTVTITWDTDVAATGEVDYQDSNGGSSQTDGTLNGRHSFTLTGLDANAFYHYQLLSDDGHGDVANSGDNTFLTPIQPPPVVVPITPPTQVIIVLPPTEVAIKAVPTETVPPQVTMDTTWSGPVKTPPKVTGIATDNEAVARVEYSTDGGKDWLPVDTADGIGGATVRYSFTPTQLDDGNYQIEVMATDTSGNHAVTQPVTLVVDRLPPQVGELVFSFGPEILTPDANGLTSLIAGSDYHFTTSALGGATSIIITAHRPSSQTVVSSFGLAQSPESGLWAGGLRFSQSGVFELDAASVDGAGNHTTRSLGNVAILPAGKVVDTARTPVTNATVKVYYLEPASKTWVVWDGTPYGETNPQAAPKGMYSMMVPAGQYYVQASAKGYTTLVTQRFTVNAPTSLTAELALSKAPHVGIGKYQLVLPTISLRPRPIDFEQIHFSAGADPLIGAKLPTFNLPVLSGGTRRSVELNGRPSVVTLLDTWSPASDDQLQALAKVQTDSDVGVYPVFEQESSALAKNYLATAGYDLDGLADPDGVLVEPLHLGVGPEHIFLDRSGHVKKLMVGVLSEATILKELGGM